MSTGIFIQARTNSERLPGKIYSGLPADGDLSLLEHIYRRLGRVSGVGILAVLAPETDERLLRFCQEREIQVFAGPEDDVRKRYRLAAQHYGVDYVIRATGDNPCVDPIIARDTIRHLQAEDVDLLSYNNLPLGVAVEGFRLSALLNEDTREEQIFREHVSLHIKHHPDLFSVCHLQHPIMKGYEGKPLPRLTVDTADDLKVVRRLFSELGSNFHIGDILELWKTNPEFLGGNEKVIQRTFIPQGLIG